MGFPKFGRLGGGVLGEMQQNRQDSASRSPKKLPEDRAGRTNTENQRSPQKSGFATVSLKSLGSKDTTKLAKTKEPKEDSPTKPKKTKSTTNLVGFLSRPKSSKDLNKLVEEETRQTKDKENRTPPSSLSDPSPPPPIYAQFCSQGLGSSSNLSSPFDTGSDPFLRMNSYTGRNDQPSPSEGVVKKQRPMSFQPQSTPRPDADRREERGRSRTKDASTSQKSSTWRKARSASRPRIFGAFAGSGQKTKPSAQEPTEPLIDPKDIDKHLEAMLDRRNIPENQRYKMRNLNCTIKMEFIRQDWAEAEAKKLERPRTNDSDTSMEGAGGDSGHQDDKKKTSRGRSLTLSKSRPKPSVSPTKKGKKEGTLGRHFRSKSTDSVASDRPESAGSSSSNGLLAKVTGAHNPGDFVAYLRKVQKPELVEVGKLHKLRLLLRNERVAWAEDFIRQGGMKEIVGLLHRIMEVEWREEHEDALLHENLLCLKALCTTALALQYLHSIQPSLFPALIHMIFDPEKKGPSDFTTRNIITSVLLTYIESSTSQERMSRAQTVLSYLRDPEAKEEERPVSFVLEMRRERPYRVWCKEVVSVTKEVFWIFLHNLNVVSLPAGDKPSKGGQTPTGSSDSSASSTSQALATGHHEDVASNEPYAYMARHFPQERPPVPAAPYVGGVEWDATNYLASHLDLMNAIIACTPTAAERNRLREHLRISGLERCLGGSLRLCKEKFYPGVHDGLRTWVAAAAEDGWDVKDVRFGPPPETRSSPRKAGGGGAAGKKKAEEAPPKLDMPKLDFALDGPLAGGKSSA